MNRWSRREIFKIRKPARVSRPRIMELGEWRYSPKFFWLKNHKCNSQVGKSANLRPVADEPTNRDRDVGTRRHMLFWNPSPGNLTTWLRLRQLNERRIILKWISKPFLVSELRPRHPRNNWFRFLWNGVRKG